MRAGVAPSADCALGAFQAPEPLTGLEQGLEPDAPLDLWSPSLSPDGLTLFFAVSVDGGDELIATATWQDGGSAFSPGSPLGGVNSTGQDGTPLLSADGLSLYFFSTREGGLGRRDVWRAARPALAADFAAPTLVAGINGPDDDHLPWLSPDEPTMLGDKPPGWRGRVRYLDCAPSLPQRRLLEHRCAERRQRRIHRWSRRARPIISAP
jgi:hypothetical protein